MVHVLVTRKHAYTVEHYLQTWGRDVRSSLRTIYYEDLAFGPSLPPGSYIWSDLERLSEPQLELAKTTWRQLATRPESFRLLNDPSKLLRRFDLLHTLHKMEINRFNASRVNGASIPLRFPVFLRRESEHDGALSPILNSQEEFDRAVIDTIAAGAPKDDLLAIEYCDTSDPSGIFRKYSAFRIGNRIIPRHLFHGTKWMLKLKDCLVGEMYVREEMEFLNTNPHEAQLRRVFDLANVDYGRIDYGMQGDALQVWEINTNPTISTLPGRTPPLCLAVQGIFAAKFSEALQSIDFTPLDRNPLRLNVPASLAQRMNAGLVPTAHRAVARSLNWLAQRPMFTKYTR